MKWKYVSEKQEEYAALPIVGDRVLIDSMDEFELLSSACDSVKRPLIDCEAEIVGLDETTGKALCRKDRYVFWLPVSHLILDGVGVQV
ncbi:MAG TPA: hypothetical protein ENO22_05840 [candidate division Zixibacteria bacterium]|nr:hypothetical protein [candidate division Zixibacteria bacterium]